MTDHYKDDPTKHITDEYGDDLGAIVTPFMEKYLERSRPSVQLCYDSLSAAMRSANDHRATEGLPSLEVPSFKSFSKTLGRFYRDCDTAKRAAGRAAGTGWSAPVQALLQQAAVSPAPFGRRVAFEKFMTDVKVPGQRLPLRFAVFQATEVATDYVLGIALALGFDDAVAEREVLRMVMKDKSELARSAGAASGWSGMCLPEYLETAPETSLTPGLRETVTGLGVTLVTPPEGQSVNRPIERLLGSLRTSEKYTDLKAAVGVEANNDKPETVLSLVRSHLIRFICDVHHADGKNSLGDKSPEEARAHSMHRYRSTAVPTPDVLRVTLGEKARRSISEDGVDLAGMRYVSPVLEHIRKARGNALVDIRYDADDMRAISVEHEGQWHSVGSIVELPADVSFDELLDVHRRLTRAWPGAGHEQVSEALRTLRSA